MTRLRQKWNTPKTSSTFETKLYLMKCLFAHKKKVKFNQNPFAPNKSILGTCTLSIYRIVFIFLYLFLLKNIKLQIDLQKYSDQIHTIKPDG